MSICEYCRPIFFQRDSVVWASILKYKAVNNLRPPRDLFEGNWACRLCETFQKDLPWPDDQELDKFELIFNRGIGTGLYGSHSDIDVMEIKAVPVRNYSRAAYIPARAYYRMFAETRGPLSSLIRAVPVERDGTSGAAFARMNDLTRSHVNMEAESVLPTRVLDIQGRNTQHVRLCETRGKLGRYAALSHCWGSSKEFTTTIDTIEERLTSIEIAQMPKTFQDAITVARELCLPYLWIDSLCIMQQNKDDWDAESSKMGDYYGNATLTIAAANAATDTAGFLRERSFGSGLGDHNSFDTIYADECSVFEFDDGNEVRRLYLRKVNRNKDTDFSKLSDPVGPEPLQGRAWTLQERSLSKQVLHFGRAQNYLEDHETNSIYFEDGQRQASLAHWSQLHDPEKALPFQHWYAMVREFMTRDITNRSDTLPALSGIAQRIAGQSNGKYVAGLWESDLARGLLWRVLPRQFDHHRGKFESESYRAPSWSWASSDKSIFFLVNDLTLRTEQPPFSEHGYNYGPESVDMSLVTRWEADFQPLSCDQFGRLQSASLSLTAPVLKINRLAEHKPFGSLLFPGPSIFVSMPDSTLYIANAYLDDSVKDLGLGVTHLYAVFISYIMGYTFRTGCGGHPHNLSSLGMIVRRLDGGEDVYRRIGVFKGLHDVDMNMTPNKSGPVSGQSFTAEDHQTITIV